MACVSAYTEHDGVRYDLLDFAFLEMLHVHVDAILVCQLYATMPTTCDCHIPSPTTRVTPVLCIFSRSDAQEIDRIADDMYRRLMCDA